MATVEKRGKGYRITVAAGIDMNGKQIRHRMVWVPDESLTARQTEKELNRQIVRFEEQVKSGAVLSDGNIRFADFAQRYITEYGQLHLKPTTLDNYKRNLSRINQAIGHIRLKELTPLHIQAFYRNLQEKGTRKHSTATATPALSKWMAEHKATCNSLAKMAGVGRPTLSNAMNGMPVSVETASKIAQAIQQNIETLFTIAHNTKPLTPATIHSYHRTLSSILEKAVKWRCIPSNPAEKAELPSLSGHKANYLDEPDAKRMLHLLQKEPIKWRAPIIFDLLSGLRRAELLGLRWRDVDINSCVVHITQTSNYVSGKGVYVGSPKTEGSDRYLKISRTAIHILLEYRLWQDQRRKAAGDAWECSADDDRIFTNELGRPLFPASLTQWMHKFIKRTGLPPSTVHSLRHTYASLLIAEGIPLVVVSGNLGHTQVSTTSDIYSHVIASAEAKAAKALNKFADDIHPKFTPKDKKEEIS